MSGGKRKREVETDGYEAFATRVVRGLQRRASTDPDALAALVRVQAETKQAIGVAIGGLKADGWSWREIALRLGTTHQAVAQCYQRHQRNNTKEGAAP